MENGELKYQLGLVEEEFYGGTLGDSFNSYYRINPSNTSKRISIKKREYNRLKKQFEGDGQVVEIDWKPLAEYGR